MESKKCKENKNKTLAKEIENNSIIVTIDCGCCTSDLIDLKTLATILNDYDIDLNKKKKKVVYSKGDVFRKKNSKGIFQYYMLVSIKSEDTTSNIISMINLTNGYTWSSRVKVNDTRNISEEEFAKITYSERLIKIDKKEFSENL